MHANSWDCVTLHQPSQPTHSTTYHPLETLPPTSVQPHHLFLTARCLSCDRSLCTWQAETGPCLRPSQVDLFKVELTEELRSGFQDASNTSDERTRQINEMIGSLERAVGEVDSKAVAARVSATEVREHSGTSEGTLRDLGGCWGMLGDLCGGSSQWMPQWSLGDVGGCWGVLSAS